MQPNMSQSNGFGDTKLTYRHDGRDYRLTGGSGHVVRDILA